MLNVLTLTVLLSTPLVLAAMGGFTSERGGVINIGLEGLMLMAACVDALVAPAHGPVAGLFAGLSVSVLFSLVHWLSTQYYRIDHVISGMAVNLLAAGASNFLFGRFSDPNMSGSIPVLPISLFVSLGAATPVFLWWYASRTRGGLRLLAVGSDPEKARLAGIAPLRVRLLGLIATGVLAGLGGIMLVTYTKTFTDGMTSGRGYIALAALILGGWRPLYALAACLTFGFFFALQVQLQGISLWGVQPPSEVWTSLPYLVTVVALAGFLGKNRTPAGLGKA